MSNKASIECGCIDAGFRSFLIDLISRRKIEADNHVHEWDKQIYYFKERSGCRIDEEEFLRTAERLTEKFKIISKECDEALRVFANIPECAGG